MRFGDITNLLNGKQKKSLLEATANEDMDSPVSGKKVKLSEDDLAFVSGGGRVGPDEVDGMGEKSEEKWNMWQR